MEFTIQAVSGILQSFSSVIYCYWHCFLDVLITIFFLLKKKFPYSCHQQTYWLLESRSKILLLWSLGLWYDFCFRNLFDNYIIKNGPPKSNKWKLHNQGIINKLLALSNTFLWLTVLSSGHQVWIKCWMYYLTVGNHALNADNVYSPFHKGILR